MKYSEKYSDADKIACLKRELKMRRNVYGRRVEEGRMTPEAMQREIGIMTEILEEFEKRER